MNKEEFKQIRTALGYTLEKMAKELRISRGTVVNIENGSKDVDIVLESYIRKLVKEKSELIFMDVTNIDKLSLIDMVKFCLKSENKNTFLNTDEIKILIDNIKNQERISIYEKHIILKNQGEPN